jgi:hypothetical protein
MKAQREQQKHAKKEARKGKDAPPLDQMRSELSRVPSVDGFDEDGFDEPTVNDSPAVGSIVIEDAVSFEEPLHPKRQSRRWNSSPQGGNRSLQTYYGKAHYDDAGARSASLARVNTPPKQRIAANKQTKHVQSKLHTSTRTPQPLGMQNRVGKPLDLVRGSRQNSTRRELNSPGKEIGFGGKEESISKANGSGFLEPRTETPEVADGGVRPASVKLRTASRAKLGTPTRAKLGTGKRGTENNKLGLIASPWGLQHSPASPSKFTRDIVW